MGPRAPRIGNAVVWALAYVGLQSLTHLAYMKVRVRYGTAQNQIEKALTAKAAELNGVVKWKKLACLIMDSLILVWVN